MSPTTTSSGGKSPPYKQSILVVDDATVNHLLIKGVLLDDYRILSVQNGSEMWKVLETNRPDLILMDVLMPEIDGFELTQKLTSHSEYSDIPIIFLTAKDSAKDLKKGFDSGGMDYIKKPFNNTELKARIKSVLRIKGLEYELKMLSVTDPLTQLYNRRHFFEVAVKELERNLRQEKKKSLSLAILDIDHFKKVNDNFGHQAGDYILAEFAALIRRDIRRYDIPARYGGEEFVILFIDAEIDTALEILGRLKDRFTNSTFQHHSKEIHCSFSCGLVQLEECQTHPITIDNLIRIADKRLYIAKEKGRNRIEASPDTLPGKTRP